MSTLSKRNLKLTCAYDGTRYFGWQKTNTKPSIEERLQQVLEQILQEPIVLQAASRTDAGVHAKGQVVNFITTKHRHAPRLLFSLNRLLPDDIRILTLEEAASTFHPTLDCSGKEYEYFICNRPVQFPWERFDSWHIPSPLDIKSMGKACRWLIGKHDFEAFCNDKKNAKYTDFIREVTKISIEENDDQRIKITVAGNHFLYKMVRNIVGTLVYVGKGKIAENEVSTILKNKIRTHLGITAPAHGLYLSHVFY